MPFIEVKLWKGRETAVKKELIRGITDVTVKTVKCPPEAVHVVIEEYEKSDWGIGGIPSSETARP
ncbi:MAG: 4-oxalocrotonate tautomerase family protein [Elusimicrobia bacterium]|nr:4-oxalocrotonate tautomerase family protein [Elusimicrobiota bacterium]